jgi:Spy/CpxP family protein refolding chaperone
VHVLPPFARDRLTLTAEQEKELAALEKEARARLDAILTPEQRKRLEEARPPRKE